MWLGQHPRSVPVSQGPNADGAIEEGFDVIDVKLVDYLAGLSRLELREGEKQAMTAGLEQIVADRKSVV